MPNTKPFVAAAFICERVLQEKDEVFSAIRIVDIYTVGSLMLSASQPVTLQPPAPGVTSILGLTALVMLKAGDVTGTHEVSILARSPEGKETPFPQSFPVVLPGTDPALGVNLVVRFFMPGDNNPGLYWFDVLWDGERLTSIPLKLVKQSQSQGVEPG